MSLLVAGYSKLYMWRWNEELIDDTGEFHFSLLYEQSLLFPLTHLSLSTSGHYVAMLNESTPFVTVFVVSVIDL